ncbi:WAT1-related protein At5g40240-like isoform X2 [Macadamia integrifolia]|uniref:WAT1-related protein At5g40240-like isoform X2 n=1 Tax=Macadamia integrifolia TaxID=60698 RepID=UPI001C4E40E5|nr:WAT1-related protein At5g40240-like isoform X2 [Macadamia integrifolia]
MDSPLSSSSRLPSSPSGRKVNRPITLSILRKLLLLGLLGYSGQIFSYTGIRYSSPTLSAAISNLVPVFTFLLAIIFRMEKLELRSSSSQAKSIGTIVSIAGAFVVTLYKGHTILMMTTSSPSTSPHHLLVTTSPSNWVIGGLFIATSSMLFAFWYILQANIVKEYPAEVTITCIYTFFVTIQSAVVSLITERKPSAWSLSPGLVLITILYSAFFGPTFSTAIHTWCIHKRGPVYAAMFRPLGIVIAVVMGVLFLGDSLRLGSILGSMIIILGFYGVMWGKSEENKLVDDKGINGSESSTQNEYLLPKQYGVEWESLLCV